MYIKIGNTEINVLVEFDKDSFYELYRPLLSGIDINEAWKTYSYYYRKHKPKKQKPKGEKKTKA
jgi:hypothetical protein